MSLCPRLLNFQADVKVWQPLFCHGIHDCTRLHLDTSDGADAAMVKMEQSTFTFCAAEKGDLKVCWDHCNHLKALIINTRFVLGPCLAQLIVTSCPLLEDIDLGHQTTCRAGALVVMCNVTPHLRCVQIVGADMTDDDLIALVQEKHSMYRIILNDCIQLTNKSLEAIIQYCSNLTRLVSLAIVRSILKSSTGLGSIYRNSLCCVWSINRCYNLFVSDQPRLTAVSRVQGR